MGAAGMDFDAMRERAIAAEGAVVLHHITHELLHSLADVWQSVCDQTGNCFPVAAIVGLAAERAGYRAVVVHGRPTLQVAPHTPYEHAWVEAETRMGCMAIDLSNGCNAVLPVERYYAIGKIASMLDTEIVYEPTELWKLIAEQEHYGPYHLQVQITGD